MKKCGHAMGARQINGELLVDLTGASEIVGLKPKAIRARVERRLSQRKREAAVVVLPVVEPLSGLADEDFGEILRHELNNPLTGILGNAELLLAEVRRRKDGRLPQDAQLRLETITDLAVRLRETVRRLSQQLEERQTRTPA